MESLKGRHVLILGGSDGIGLAAAQYLLGAGSVVTIGGRSSDRLAGAADELRKTVSIQDRLRTVQVDANESDAVGRAIEVAKDSQGAIQGIVVVAGAGDFATILDSTPEFVVKQLTSNLLPLVNAINLGVPAMGAAGGAIVGVSSSAGIQTSPGLVAFGAAKAALDHYVRGAADELGVRKIRVNAVRPALTKTGSTHYVFSDEKLISSFVEQTPLGRYGVPDDFGGVIAFLMSDEARWITGQCIAVDGGLTLRRFPSFG